MPQSPSASLTKSPSTNAKRKGNIKVNPKYSPLHLAVYDNNFERVMEQLNGDGIRYVGRGRREESGRVARRCEHMSMFIKGT